MQHIEGSCRIRLLVVLTIVFHVTIAIRANYAQCVFQQIQASVNTGHDKFGTSVAISGDWLVVGAPSFEDEVIGSGAAVVFRRDDQGTPRIIGDDEWVVHETLIPPGSTNHSFGFSIATDGDWLLVGANEELTLQGNTGGVFVYRRNDNNTPTDSSDDEWVSSAHWIPSGKSSRPEFGSSLAINDDRVVVGAPRDEEYGQNSGAAYVFRRDDAGTPSVLADDVWIEESTLHAPQPFESAYFGFSVSTAGNRLSIGARNGNAAEKRSGAAYVYRRDTNGTPLVDDDDSWILESKLIAPSLSDRLNWFGYSVSMTRDRVLVGAPYRGESFLFRRDDQGTLLDETDDDWVLETELQPKESSGLVLYGQSVVLQNGWAVVGVPNDLHPLPETGSVYVFQLNDNGTPVDTSDDQWVETGKVASTLGYQGRLGFSVAADGNWAAAGAPFSRAGPAVAGAADVILLESPEDEDKDGVFDGCDNCFELVNPDQADCDRDGIGDVCAIADGLSNDCNGNGVPDECPGCELDCECESPTSARAGGISACVRDGLTCQNHSCGLITAVIEIAYSPLITPGPVTRCIDLKFRDCEAGIELDHEVSVEVVFGGPFGQPGQGTAIVDIPAREWTCFEAVDPLHTLKSAGSIFGECALGCVENFVHMDPNTGEETNLGPVWLANLTEPPDFNSPCHWLIGGNANHDPVIDIVDYVIWAGGERKNMDGDTPCGAGPFDLDADFNGDGIINATDFSFVAINFFEDDKSNCDYYCGGGTAAANSKPRAFVSLRELAEMGFDADAIRRADANRDGVVDVADIAATAADLSQEPLPDCMKRLLTQRDRPTRRHPR